MCLDLHITDYTRMQVVHLLPTFVFMMGRFMYWTMLPRWRLAIAYTDIINSKLVYFVKGDGSSGDIVALQGDRNRYNAMATTFKYLK